MASQAPTEAGCSALGMVDGKPEATLLDKLQAAGVVKPSVETRSTPPKLFNLCLQETFADDKKLLRRLEFGARSDKPVRTIMFLGATGAGKTTSLNALVNHIMGVNFDDDFRLLLIDETGTKENQAHSQTKWVTAYVLHWRPEFSVPYTLVLVDTPGFGDTSGIARDRRITEQLREFFQESIPALDAVGFVIQSSLPRLTPSQSYVYESVLSLFGKDIAENILVLATFADAGKAKVTAALKEANIPYRKLLKLNNSALFAENSSREDQAELSDAEDANSAFNKMFWEMGRVSFKHFFLEISKLTPNALESTRSVLKNRKDIEDHIQCINAGIQNGMNLADQLRQEIQVMKKHESEIAANKNFTYTVTQSRTVTKTLPVGLHVTNCLNCNLTCHYNCAFADDSQKASCCAMNSSGTCTVCPKGCHWQMHKNMRYHFEVAQETVTKTADEVKAKYEKAKQTTLTHKELVDAMVEDYASLQLRVSKLLDEVRKSVNLLRQIALRDDPLSQIDYIDLMIQSEEQGRKPGYKERILQLQQVRQEVVVRAQMLADGYSPWKDHEAAIHAVIAQKPAAASEEENPRYWASLMDRLKRSAVSYFKVGGS